jgi:hypothetical protein
LGAVAVIEMCVSPQFFAPHDGCTMTGVVAGTVFGGGMPKADIHLSARHQECVTFEVNSRVAMIEHARRTGFARHQVIDDDWANVGQTRFISSLQVLRRFHLTSLPFMEACFTGCDCYTYRPVEPKTLPISKGSASCAHRSI